MNLLCLDIGNTSITICKSYKKMLGPLNRIPSSKNFTEILSDYDPKSIDSIIMCSVVPELTTILVNYCKSNNIDKFEINYKKISILILL